MLWLVSLRSLLWREVQGRKKRMKSEAGVMKTPSGLLSCYSRPLVRKDVKHFESVRGKSRLQDYCKLRLVKMTLRLYNYGHSDYFFPPSYCSDVASKSTCFNLLCFFIVFFFWRTERPFMVWALIKTEILNWSHVDFLQYTYSAESCFAENVIEIRIFFDEFMEMFQISAFEETVNKENLSLIFYGSKLLSKSWLSPFVCS